MNFLTKDLKDIFVKKREKKTLFSCQNKKYLPHIHFIQFQNFMPPQEKTMFQIDVYYAL